jgi:K+-transporting ATPase ATPase C chain
MKNTITALKLFLCMTVLTGIIYPFVVWCCGQMIFKEKAEGSILVINGRSVGSKLIGQNFSGPEYFCPRPSAVDYNPMPSGASNMSLTSAQMQAALKDRKAKFIMETVPSDLLFASGSGLDPHISPEAAHIQCSRVAHMRGVPEVDIMSLVDAITEQRQAGFLGEPRVNVLRLNLKLDEGYQK